jgi:DNA/RNA-binding domain of Phe-tRNA-synthetase-like protein
MVKVFPFLAMLTYKIGKCQFVPGREDHIHHRQDPWLLDVQNSDTFKGLPQKREMAKQGEPLGFPSENGHGRFVKWDKSHTSLLKEKAQVCFICE